MKKDSRKKKRLGSYPYVSVVFSITLALFVIGLFGMLMLHTKKLTSIIKDNIEIQVYLNKDITDNQRLQVQQSLASKDYVATNNDETQISFISKENAAQKFIEETGENFSEFLGQNPLRDAFIIKIAPDFQDAENLKIIKTEIEQISGIFEVVYVESLVDSINANLTKISMFLLGFSIILLIAVVLLINNTIKLALFSQRFLIRSMQLVGATGGFIKRPFLIRSISHGIISGLIAIALLTLFLNFANNNIEDLEQLQDGESIMILYSGLLILGAIIGSTSTYRAISKYLKLSLDELY